jgi:phage/plasmid-associated DNA primase
MILPVKQLCSTDEVFAEKKYKDPFSFKPCHTLVLYTNHLPRVSASDDGIWRRLIVIPFGAKIEGKTDIKNYGEYLYENAGESILALGHRRSHEGNCAGLPDPDPGLRDEGH